MVFLACFHITLKMYEGVLGPHAIRFLSNVMPLCQHNEFIMST